MFTTKRDLVYLKAIFSLGGYRDYITPTQLCKALKVTKVTAYQKMKRLATMGFGSYQRREGFILNKKSIRNIEKIIYQHHVLENFFTETLGVSCSQACHESSQITSNLSDEFIEIIYKKLGEPANCNCGCKIPPPYEKKQINGCNWCLDSYGVQS